MKTLIRHAALLATALVSQHALAVTYTTPDGMWDLVSNSSILIKTSTGQTTEPLNQVFSQIQYLSDKSYKAYDWSGIQGNWQQVGNTYQAQVNIASANASKTSPAYVNRLVNKFTDYATRLYGTAPTLSTITLKSFVDTATLVNNGLELQGTLKSTLVVTYTDPKTRQVTTAKLKVNGTYKGLRASAPSTCCVSAEGLANQAKSQKFLDRNAELPGVLKTSSGLQYKVIQKAGGNTPKPLATDTVKVSYRGYLPSGQVFDANSGITFPLNGVISGWTEGLQLMSVGDYYRFYIPSELAYGNRTVGTYIKPNSALLFDVILEGIE